MVRAKYVLGLTLAEAMTLFAPENKLADLDRIVAQLVEAKFLDLTLDLTQPRDRELASR